MRFPPLQLLVHLSKMQVFKQAVQSFIRLTVNNVKLLNIWGDYRSLPLACFLHCTKAYSEKVLLHDAGTDIMTRTWRKQSQRGRKRMIHLQTNTLRSWIGLKKCNWYVLILCKVSHASYSPTSLRDAKAFPA